MSPAGAADDLGEVVRRLEEVHPGFVDVVGPDRWGTLRADTLAALGAVDTPADFWWAVAPLVASGGDGHTTLWPPAGRVEAPWTVELRDDGPWVLDWGTQSGPLLPEGGARLVSVEGLPADALAESILARFGGESAGFRRWRVEGEWWRTLPLAVAAAGGAATGTWHVVVERDGRRREGLVSPDATEWERSRGWLNVWFVDGPTRSPWAEDACGARIEQVLPGGAADRAGLRAGDLVTAMDGRPVRSLPQLSAWLAEVERGQEVHLGVLREGVPLDVVARAGRWRPWTPAWTFTQVGETLLVDLDAFVEPAAFATAFDAALASGRPARVIVDLRGNDGGDAQMPELLCARLCSTAPRGFEMVWRHSREAHRDQRREWGVVGPLADLVAPRGSFLGTPVGGTWAWWPTPVALAATPAAREVDVLVDGGTFSAGVYAAHLLHTSAGAELWGEPPGSGPRFFAHGVTDWLPNSGLSLQVSSATFRVVGARDALVPDHQVPSRLALRAALGR